MGNNTGGSAVPTYFPPLLESALFKDQGTTNTVLHGNASGNPSWGQIVNGDIAPATIDLTTKVTGVLPLANGGTNASLTATFGGAVYSTSSGMGITAVGTPGQVLTSNGAAAPSWTSPGALGIRWDQIAAPTANLTLSHGSNITAFSFDGLTGANANAFALSSSSTTGTASSSSRLLNLSRTGANASLAHTAYGIYSTVTNTNATSGTNIAGYFSASGATTGNYAAIFDQGNVGIGTTAPATALDVYSKFQVDNNGNIVKLNNVTTNFPSANAAGFLQNNGSGTLSWVAGNSGTVTSVSVVSANGLAGTVASATTTPAITLSTTITGMLKGNGTSISAGVAGTDFVSPNASITAGTNTKITYDSKGLVTAGSSAVLQSADFANQGTTTTVLHGNAGGNPSWGQIVNGDIAPATIDLTTKVTGVLPVANGGTGASTLSSNSILLGNGTSAISALTLGTANQLLGMNLGGTAHEYKTLSGTANQISVTFPSAGAILLSTPQDIHTVATPTFAGLTLSTTPLGLSSGGTNANLTAVNGGVVWSNTSQMQITAAGTSGQVLTSNGAAAPSWTSPGALGIRWDQIANPTTNLSLSHGTNTTTMNTSVTTDAFLSITGTAVTSGQLQNISTSGNSWTGNGTSNGLLTITSSSNGGAGVSSSVLFRLLRTGTNSNNTHTAYGIYSEVLNTGGSSTNVGGYFSANSATNNYAAIFDLGNVGIGTTIPAAKLEINSTTDGILIPRMTSGERASIAGGSPPNSLLVYDTGQEGFYYYNSSETPPAWERVSGSMCPSGYEKVNEKYCIQNGENSNGNLSFWSASSKCIENNSRLCAMSEWVYACQNVGSLTDKTGNYEWVEFGGVNSSHTVGNASCTDTQIESFSTAKPFRCCFSR